jgi:hypothetical protein
MQESNLLSGFIECLGTTVNYNANIRGVIYVLLDFRAERESPQVVISLEQSYL